MKITDGKRTIKIEMYGNNGCEWSRDFFGDKGFDYDEETDIYNMSGCYHKNDSVEDCIIDAEEYGEDSDVEVEEIEVEA